MPGAEHKGVERAAAIGSTNDGLQAVPRRTAEAEASESESESENDRGSSCGGDSSMERGDESSEEEDQGRDGMADMMSRILHQHVDGGRIPVLAKRKTTIMKQLEQEKASHDRLKEARRQKREDKGKFMVVPDHSTGDYERQLRKVATRGVVALFNAITKAKREELEKDENGTKTVAPKSKAAEVGALSRMNFVGLLQKETAKAATSSSSSNVSASASASASEGQQDDANDEDGSEKTKKKSGWSALEDGLLVDRKLALKDWDQDDDSEGNSEGDVRERPYPNSKLEDPFRDLSEMAVASDRGGKKGSKKSKKRPAEESSDDDDDYKKQYPKKRAGTRKK